MANDSNQWDRVQWYIRDCILISLVVAGLLHILPLEGELSSMACFLSSKRICQNIGLMRATIFFEFSYIFILPTYALRSLIALRNMRVKKSIAIHEKLIVTFLSLIFSCGMIALPYLILFSEPHNYWRISSLYWLLTNSYLGLSLAGGVMLYGALLALIVICGAVPKIWTANKMENFK